MPWKECKPMDERLRFIARLLGGENMAPLCREFGISRVTGYKIFKRYKECGLNGLNDRRRAPYRQANRLPYPVERAILGIKPVTPSLVSRGCPSGGYDSASAGNASSPAIPSRTDVTNACT